MYQKLKYLFFTAILLSLVLISCNKKNKIQSEVDPSEVNFVLTQPSLATATFIAKCTNYDVRLDTIIFLDPNSSLYYQNLNNRLYQKNEEFMIGGYTPIDGIWIVQFRGIKEESQQTFDVSLPYDMNIEGDDDEE